MTEPTADPQNTAFNWTHAGQSQRAHRPTGGYVGAALVMPHERNTPDPNTPDPNAVMDLHPDQQPIRPEVDGSAQPSRPASPVPPPERSHVVGAAARRAIGTLPADTPRLDATTLAPPPVAIPQKGIRRLLSGMGIKVKPSKTQLEEMQKIKRMSAPIAAAPFVVAVAEVKGGGGKTTNAITVAEAFAEQTGYRVCVMCGNPDNGNALERVVRFNTQEELLRFPASIDLYRAEMQARAENGFGLYEASKITQFLGLGGRLYALGSKQLADDNTDEDVDSGLTGEQMRVTIECLSRVFDVIVIDCGTSTSRAAFKAALRLADGLLLVANPKKDVLTKAEITLDEIARRRPDLVANAVVSISYLSPQAGQWIDTHQTVEYFQSRARAVYRFPYDQEIDRGDVIDWHRVGATSRDAATNIAAALGDLFPTLQPKQR